MFEAEFSLEALHLCLADLPPVELKGMVLLRERRPLGQFFPTGFAREVVAASKEHHDLPWLVFFQGGPGGKAPRPDGRSGWLNSRRVRGS